MSKSLKEALLRLQTRPTAEVVKEAELLALNTASSFQSTEQVEVVAAIMARLHLGEGNFAGISCQCPLVCASTSMIFGWLKRDEGAKFYIPVEFRAQFKEKLKTWETHTSKCSCVLASHVRRGSQEAAEAAKAEEARKLYEADNRENGHQYGAVMDA
jgi:hypothetical protein